MKAITIGLALAALVAAGCGGGEGRLPTYPVSGTVHINGHPAAGCTVAFVPLDPKRKGTIMPGGKTDEAGSFTLTTYETGDGAPAGEYGVTLRWEATKWQGMERDRRSDPVDPIGPDRLMGQFNTPDKSGLKVTIVEGPNKLEPFRLEGVRLMKGAR